MRFKAFTGTSLFMEYPDYIIFTQDNNTIKVSSSLTTDTVGARIVVREPTGNQLVLDYWSETNEIVFLLNDSIDQLFNDNTSEWDVLVEAYSNSAPQATFSFHMKVCDGKSFTDRSHAADTVIYWTDINDLKKIQVFSYEGGTATVLNTNFTLVPGINSLNLYNMHLSNEEKIHIVSQNVLDTTPAYFGDMWNNTVVNAEDYYITLKYVDVCDNKQSCRIYYTDCDGCGRFIAGLISKETNNAKGTNYGRIESIYRNGAYKLTTSTSKVLTVGFTDIPNTAFLSDIFYSNSVYMVNYNGDRIPVSINSSKIETKDTINDYEIEFLINNEN